MKITIRKYVEPDCSQIIDLWNDIFRPTKYHNDPDRTIKMKNNHDDLFYVAEFDNKIIGTVIIGFDGHRGWIYALAVKKEFQRKGIGTKLVDKAINVLRDLGCLKVNIQIMSNNSNVVNFYKKCDFEIEERISMGLKLY